MSFLLDTNALSEISRKSPDSGFLTWYDATDDGLLFASAVTFGELRRGAALLQPGAKRTHVESHHRVAVTAYARRVISADLPVMVRWGELSADNRRNGRAPGMADEIIAATALVHELTVVTRNIADFQHAGCRVLSPWTA